MSSARSNAMRPLPWFFVAPIVVAAPLFFAVRPETPSSVQLLLLLAGSTIPAIAAWVALRVERNPEETAAFRRRVRTWRVAKRWVVAAVLIPTAVWLAAAGLVGFLRMTVPFQPAALLAFPIIFLTNLGEEIGWRGFALPRLLPRFNAVTASVILGIIWGAFHVPLYWGRPVFVVLNFGLTIPFSVVLTWLFLRTGGSVLLSTVLHAVFNTWGQAFLSGEGWEGMFAVSVFFMWVAADILVIHNGSSLRRGIPDPGDRPKRRPAWWQQD